MPTFANLSLKGKATAIIIGIISLWLAIRAIPTFNEFAIGQFETKFLQELTVVVAVYLFAVWILPIAFGIVLNMINRNI